MTKEHILTFDVSTEHPEAICMDQKKPERCDWSYRVISMMIEERERLLTEREKDSERERIEKGESEERSNGSGQMRHMDWITLFT